MTDPAGIRPLPRRQPRWHSDRTVRRLPPGAGRCRHGRSGSADRSGRAARSGDLVLGRRSRGVQLRAGGDPGDLGGCRARPSRRQHHTAAVTARAGSPSAATRFQAIPPKADRWCSTARKTKAARNGTPARAAAMAVPLASRRRAASGGPRRIRRAAPGRALLRASHLAGPDWSCRPLRPADRGSHPAATEPAGLPGQAHGGRLAA